MGAFLKAFVSIFGNRGTKQVRRQGVRWVRTLPPPHPRVENVPLERSKDELTKKKEHQGESFLPLQAASHIPVHSICSLIAQRGVWNLSRILVGASVTCLSFLVQILLYLSFIRVKTAENQRTEFETLCWVRPHPHNTIFKRKRYCFVPDTAIPSTLQRRKQSAKTNRFKNALQSGTIWKRYCLKMLFS